MHKKEQTLASRRILPAEIKGLLLLFASFLILLSIITFSQGEGEKNWLGLLGYGTAYALTYLFGLGTYLILTFTTWVSIRLISKGCVKELTARIVYFSILLFSVLMLLNLAADHFPRFAILFTHKIYTQYKTASLSSYEPVRYYLGGVPLYYIYKDIYLINLYRILSPVGIGIIFSITGMVAYLQLTKWKALFLFCKGMKKLFTLTLSIHKAPLFQKKIPKPPLYKAETTLSVLPIPPKLIAQDKKTKAQEETPDPQNNFEALVFSDREFKKNKPLKTEYGKHAYKLPPLSLLTEVKKLDSSLMKKELAKQAQVLEEALLSFGIEAKVGQIFCGPTITSFEVHPAIGVKVQRIKAVENDMALNMQAKAIRIIAPIPGKACVGVEIPSPQAQEVSFKEILNNYFHSHKPMKIPVILGKTVTGEDVISDLTKMPHCIIAGATGSGKSVCINTVVMSILMTAKPEEIKLLMIDPKKVELTAYNSLPHMIAPVITEAKDAAAALNWLVKEMERRYEKLKEAGARHIIAYNEKESEKLPYIVGIIDELADLMMVAAQDIETPIARIAQMARAVGIHLILATQRPSREVITGLIKANFPTRIAFKVASRINSQIILDDVGAESLLGNGDMLFLPPGASTLIRTQGAFIRDEDIHKVISAIEKEAPPNYLIKSFDLPEFQEKTGAKSEESSDPLYVEAFSIVQETGVASTTFLQRKLKIGYARAASLIDQLEHNKIIGPQEGAKPRKVFSKAAE